MKILDLPQGIKERRLFGLFDDFLWYISPHLWSSFNTGTGGASVAPGSSAFGGTAVLTTGATANNEAAIATTNSPFSPGDDRENEAIWNRLREMYWHAGGFQIIDNAGAQRHLRPDDNQFDLLRLGKRNDCLVVANI